MNIATNEETTLSNLDLSLLAREGWLQPKRHSKHYYARVLRAIARRKKRNTSTLQRKNAKRARKESLRREAMKRT